MYSHVVSRNNAVCSIVGNSFNLAVNCIIVFILLSYEISTIIYNVFYEIYERHNCCPLIPRLKPWVFPDSLIKEVKCQEFFQKYFLFFVSLWWVLYHIFNSLSIIFLENYKKIKAPLLRCFFVIFQSVVSKK